MSTTVTDIAAPDRQWAGTAEEARPRIAAPRAERAVLRILFKYMNRFLMVPLLKLGVAPWMSSPASGYIMLLRTRGRKSGLLRDTPLNYAIMDGAVYCLAGFGERTQWLANLKADPQVQLILPGRAIGGRAEVVSDPDEAGAALLRVVRAAGFALLFEGMNPLTVTDDQLLQQIAGRPVVRIRPTGLAAGPQDPGGWGWVLPTLAQVAGLLWLLTRLRRRPQERR